MLVAEILGNVLCQHGFVTIETDATLLVLLFTGTRSSWSDWTLKWGGDVRDLYGVFRMGCFSNAKSAD